MEPFKHIPVELIYGMVAIVGGSARYLNSYVEGRPFKLSIFAAAAFVAGFSGYMFALVGEQMHFPQEMLFIMAGCGGFFGEQTMKYILEYTTGKLN